MIRSIENKRLNRALRQICRKLRIRIDEPIGFDPSGGRVSPIDRTSRTAEFIGFYLMHAKQYAPEVKPHLAGLVLRSIEDDANQPALDALINDFLQVTRKEWEKAAPVLESCGGHPVFDFSRGDNPNRGARRELSKALKLKYPAHDWEHCNADASRAAEFVAFCHSLPESEDRTLIENALQLTFCSIDAAIRNKTLDRATREAAQRLLEGWWPDLKYIHDASLSDFALQTGPPGRLKVSEELGLICPAVDWPCYNAAPDRLLEFVDRYFEGWNQGRHIDWQIELGSLILATVSALLAERDLTEVERAAIGRFVRQQRGEQASNIAQWAARGSRKIVAVLTDAVLTAPDKDVEPWDPDLYHCPEVVEAAEGHAATYYANCALHVDHTGQDWGIVNGRAERAAEFINYYMRRRATLRVWHGMFEELICASIDDAIRQGPLDRETEVAANEFWNAAASGPSSTIQYWVKWWDQKKVTYPPKTLPI